MIERILAGLGLAFVVAIVAGYLAALACAFAFPLDRRR